MSCVNVRGCPIGEGRPKTILPIVEGTEAAIPYNIIRKPFKSKEIFG